MEAEEEVVVAEERQQRNEKVLETAAGEGEVVEAQKEQDCDVEQDCFGE